MLGSKAWGHAQAAVHIVEKPELIGVQKRQAALDVLSDFGLDLAKWLLNLAIELAVAKLRNAAS